MQTAGQNTTEINKVSEQVFKWWPHATDTHDEPGACTFLAWRELTNETHILTTTNTWRSARPSAISTTSMPCFRQSMKTSLVPHVAWKFPNSSFHGAPYSGVTPWRNKVLSVWTGIISAKSEIAKFSCHFLNACRMWETKRNVSAAVLQRHGGEWRVVVSASQTTTFTCSGNAHKQHLQPDTHLISPLCCPASISAARKNLKITEAADPFHDKTTRHCR